MEAIPSENEASQRITTFDDYLLHEVDQVSVNRSGQDLFGESFFNAVPEFTARSFSGKASGITDEEGLVIFRFIARTNNPTDVTLNINKEKVAPALLMPLRPAL